MGSNFRGSNPTKKTINPVGTDFVFDSCPIGNQSPTSLGRAAFPSRFVPFGGLGKSCALVAACHNVYHNLHAGFYTMERGEESTRPG